MTKPATIARVAVLELPAGARVPIGSPPAWLAAAIAADWQCQCTTPGKGRAKAACGRNHWEQREHRCQHQGAGACAMRLTMVETADGKFELMCEPCAAGHTSRINRTRAAMPGPDQAENGQGSLFDLFEAGG